MSKQDLDLVLLNKGKAYFLDKVKTAPTYTDWNIRSLISNVNYKGLEEKRKYVYALKPHLLTLPLINRNQYIELLSTKLMIPEIDIIRILKDKGKPLSIKTTEERYITAQKHILSTLFCGDYFGFALSYIQESHIELTQEFQSILEYIQSKRLAGKTIKEIEDLCLLELDSGVMTDILFKSEEAKYENMGQLEIFLADNFRWLIPYHNMCALKLLSNSPLTSPTV